MITVYVFHQKVAAARAKAKNVKAVPSPKSIVTNPLIQFRYPKSKASWDIPLRTVRLISVDTKYFWGLEVTRKPGTDKLSYHPKRYLRSKATQLDFINFNTPSMP